MKKLSVLGVGSAGCRITGLLKTLPGAEQLRLMGFDCDAETLKNSGLEPDNLLLAGEKWRQGRGCGGRENEGKTAAAAERETLKHLLADTSLLLVISGLGRGFGSGAMSVIQSVTAGMKLPTVFLLNTPFVFEGASRRNLAARTISRDLLPLADAVVTIPLDLLFCTLDPATSHEEAFALADRVMAEAALALTVTLSSGSRLAADFDTVSALLCRKHAICGIGYSCVDASDPEKNRKIAEQLLDSPLLGGSTKLRQADAVLLMLNGGETLSLGDAREVFENVQKFLAPETEVLTGAGADSAWGNQMRLTALTVKFDQSGEGTAALPEGSSTPLRRSRKKHTGAEDEIQPELFPENAPELGIMENTPPVIVDGVNLDVPTFMRDNNPSDGRQ